MQSPKIPVVLFLPGKLKTTETVSPLCQAVPLRLHLPPSKSGSKASQKT